ncbi:MAG: hypothetical protein AAB686_01795, partial [Patescibacteria group bacterium]
MRFYYVAQDKTKGVVKGDMEAPDRPAAIAQLVKRGVTPIKLEVLTGEEERRGNWFTRLAAFQIGGGRLTMFDQITVVRHLGTILNAGTDLLSGLEIIAKDSIKPLIKKILYDLKQLRFRGLRVTRGRGCGEVSQAHVQDVGDARRRVV